MASPTQRTWVWVNSRSWWWTGKPGVLQSMGSQRVGHDWVTELNWTVKLYSFFILFYPFKQFYSIPSYQTGFINIPIVVVQSLSRVRLFGTISWNWLKLMSIYGQIYQVFFYSYFKLKKCTTTPMYLYWYYVMFMFTHHDFQTKPPQNIR